MMNNDLPILDPDDIITVEDTDISRAEEEAFYREIILIPRIVFWLGVLILISILVSML